MQSQEYFALSLRQSRITKVFVYSLGCEPIPVQYVLWGDPEPIAAVVFACLGLLATLFVTSVFIK